MNADDDERAAEEYYQRIMEPDDVLCLKNLVSRIGRVPAPARDYLERHCRDVRELEEFFRDRVYLFFVENGKVARTSDELEEAPQMAADYFKNRLRALRNPVDFMELKSHLDHAPNNVGRYIRSFYPGKEFKGFLRQRTEVFNVRRDGTVSLIDRDSAAFFKKRLKVFGGNGNRIPFNRFRGHVGQAPPEIQSYMNRYCHGDDFQDFLRRNDDVFQLDTDGHVSLVPFV